MLVSGAVQGTDHGEEADSLGTDGLRVVTHHYRALTNCQLLGSRKTRVQGVSSTGWRFPRAMFDGLTSRSGPLCS